MNLDAHVVYQLSPKGVALAKPVFKQQNAMTARRVAFTKKYKAKSVYSSGCRVCGLGVIYKDKKGKSVNFIVRGESTPVLSPGWRLARNNAFMMLPDKRTPAGQAVAKAMEELSMPEIPEGLVGSGLGIVGGTLYRTVLHRVGKRFFVLQAACDNLIKPPHGRKVRNSFYLRCRENEPNNQEHALCL